MGAVPNAVFERLLEAVAAGQSAELMEQLNVLVNAGTAFLPGAANGALPAQCADGQAGGEHTQLLQISATNGSGLCARRCCLLKRS